MPKSASVTSLRSTAGKKVLSWGLVNVPVGLIPATDEPGGTSRPSGSFFCTTHNSKTEAPKWCIEGEHKIKPEELAKCYSFEGKDVVVTDSEMDVAKLDNDPAIVLEATMTNIDPVLFLKSYFLQPVDSSGVKPYKLLANLLAQHQGTYLIGKMIDSGAEKVLAIRSKDGILMGHICLPAELVRHQISSTIRDALQGDDPAPAEQELAELLFQALPNTFDLGEVEDKLGKRQWEVIKQKAKNKEIKLKDEKVELAANDDLMAALRATAKQQKVKVAA